METVSRGFVEEHRDDVVLVNTLSTEQFQKEHIPGSINIPTDNIRDEAPERLDKDDEIVVYCASESCPASDKAAEMLEDMGYEHVKDYEGGMADWNDAGNQTASA